MATKVIFQDPIAQYLNRYKITHLGEDIYEIQISPGTITQEGTPLTAANLNSIANEVVFHVEDTNLQANIFEANIQGLGDYYIGLSIVMKSNTTNTDTATLNLSGLGAKALKKVDKSGNKINVQANDIIKNKYEMFVYDGTDFILVNPNADIAQLISDLNSLENKVNSLSQDVQNMKNFTPRFATTTGINNDYDINIEEIAQYATGMRVTIVSDRANTGSSTLNINSLGKKNILFNGSSVPANTLQTNKLYDLIYNGVDFELQPSASQTSKLNDIGNINDSTLPVELKGKVLTEQIKQLKKDDDEHKAEKVQHLSYATASGTNTYTTAINGISSLVEGMSVKIKFTNANTGASTLNINSLGAKPIQKSNGNDLSSGNIKAGQICHLVYTGSVFQLLGEGGEYGTAQAPDVLSGRTFGTEDGIKTGSMPNNGSISKTITTQNGQIIVQKGYHNGSGIVKAQFANLVAENIKKGVNVGGVVGTFDGFFYHTTYQPNAYLYRPFLIYDSSEGTKTVSVLYFEMIQDLGFIPKFILAYNNNGFPNSFVIFNSFKSFANPNNSEGYAFNILSIRTVSHYCVVDKESAKVSQDYICLPMPAFAEDSIWDVYIFG